MLTGTTGTAVHQALGRLFEIARQDTHQSRHVADFLLAWHNARENGGWDLTDFWSVDSAIAVDILIVINFIALNRRYPNEIGYEREIQRVWELWRKGRT